MNGTSIDTNAEQSDAGADNDGASNKKVMNEDKEENGGKLLHKVNCPECHKPIVDLPRHLRSVHKWKADTSLCCEAEFPALQATEENIKKTPLQKENLSKVQQDLGQVGESSA